MRAPLPSRCVGGHRELNRVEAAQELPATAATSAAVAALGTRPSDTAPKTGKGILNNPQGV